MKKFQKLSDSEMEIMRVIWKLKAPVTSAQLLSIFDSKGWKPQTMSTFLTRMADKGLLSPITQGRTNSYTPISTEQDYRSMEAKNVIDSMYNGSMQDFLATFYGGKSVDPKEVSKLKSWFNEVTKDD